MANDPSKPDAASGSGASRATPSPTVKAGPAAESPGPADTSIRNLELFRSGVASLGWMVRGVAAKFGAQYPWLITDLRVFYHVLQIGHRAIGEVETAIIEGTAVEVPAIKVPDLPTWTDDFQDVSVLNVAFETLRPWVIKFEQNLPGHTPATQALKHWMVLLLSEWESLEVEFRRAFDGPDVLPGNPNAPVAHSEALPPAPSPVETTSGDARITKVADRVLESAG